MKSYKPTAQQYDRLARVESVDDRRQFPRWVREHMGERVAVRFMHGRGDARRATDMRIAYGTLVPANRADQYRIEWQGEGKDIYFRRITNLYAVDRPKADQALAATPSTSTSEGH